MTKLVVGLGNPGKAYELTRHNAGYIVADRFVEKKRGRYTEERADYLLATVRVRSQPLLVAKPLTFMNLSGHAIATLLRKFGLMPEQLLVLSDDFALPFGKLRIRIAGSDGGHNGLRSIIETLGTDEFPRLRLGIGPPAEGIPAEDFVLRKFSEEELDGLNDFVTLAVTCLETVLYSGLSEAMNKYNGL